MPYKDKADKATQMRKYRKRKSDLSKALKPYFQELRMHSDVYKRLCEEVKGQINTFCGIPIVVDDNCHYKCILVGKEVKTK